MTGVYRHCGEQHLHHYLSTFEFATTAVPRSNDAARIQAIAEGIGGRV